MRYAAPLAMPVALGEWLGAELEARGVEAASHYARAVLSILLHSDLEPDCDVEKEAARVAALELQIKLEHKKEKEKRGRVRKKSVVRATSHAKGKGSGAAALTKLNEPAAALSRRRPHSWNGDEDELKKSAAVECLLSATDDDEWPVEKFVDELVTRLKILQLEGMDRFRGLMGSSAPNFYSKQDFDADSLTSISSPGEPEDYLTAFPPLLDGETSSAQDTVSWGGHRESQRSSTEPVVRRVPFVRMPGTRLSPSESGVTGNLTAVENNEVDPAETIEAAGKGRLYERGVAQENAEASRNKWGDWSDPTKENIWAPDQQDWTILGKREPDLLPVLLIDLIPVDSVTRKSLAVLNHHPQLSSFAHVIPGQKVEIPGTKIFEWMGALDSKQPEFEEDKEIENLLTSPKTHFCPIQEETDGEVDIRDGFTFNIDAEPDQVHYLRSPNGALYLPEIEDNGFGWVGWIKYSVYNPPTPSILDEDIFNGKLTSAFPLKFRVVQNDKGCQTDFDADEEDRTAPFNPFRLLNGGDVWKFNVEMLRDVPKEMEGKQDEVKEDEGNFLTEIWEVTADRLVKEDEEDDKFTEDAEDSSLLKEVWDIAVEGLRVEKEREGVSEFKRLKEVWDSVDDNSSKEKEIVEENGDSVDDGALLDEVWEVAIEGAAAQEEPEEQPGDCFVEGSISGVNESMTISEYAMSETEDLILDEIWNPVLQPDDVCEWLAQPAAEEIHPEDLQEFDWPVDSDCWPPAHIPVEYVDDELFEEIIGSVESRGSQGDAKSEGKRKSRRRRRSSSKKQNQPPPQRRRPCSFFVEGKCPQPDCKYSHDLGSIPCRFWMESACFKGVACPFMHAKPSPPKSRSRNCSGSYSDTSEGGLTDEYPSRSNSVRHSRNSTSKAFELDLDNDFPSLGQAMEEHKPKSRPIPIKNTTAPSPANLSSSLGTGAVKRRRKKTRSAGQHSLKDDSAKDPSFCSPARNICSLENGITGGRLRFLSSYKEG